MEGILIEVLIIHFSAREYLTRILLQDDDKEQEEKKMKKRFLSYSYLLKYDKEKRKGEKQKKITNITRKQKTSCEKLY